MSGQNPDAFSVYHHWPLSPGQSIAPLIRRDRRGIYVLEFANGELYVGQSVDVVTRFATHVHGSSHHEPWAYIIALRFRPIPEGDLGEAERSEIQRLRIAGHTLRNKVGNLGHRQPAPLDAVVSIEKQHHKATGAPSYTLNRLHEHLTASHPLSESRTQASSTPPTRQLDYHQASSLLRTTLTPARNLAEPALGDLPRPRYSHQEHHPKRSGHQTRLLYCH
ncbi:hypothetical protein CHEID_02905 [Corynebacterium heidelbergense]|nr:hypothetical protein CHEID_02905 [Corynebacterium heidelbergense]